MDLFTYEKQPDIFSFRTVKKSSFTDQELLNYDGFTGLFRYAPSSPQGTGRLTRYVEQSLRRPERFTEDSIIDIVVCISELAAQFKHVRMNGLTRLALFRIDEKRDNGLSTAYARMHIEGNEWYPTTQQSLEEFQQQVNPDNPLTSGRGLIIINKNAANFFFDRANKIYHVATTLEERT